MTVPLQTHIARLALALAASIASVGAASAVTLGPGAGSATLTGIFSQDDDVALFDIEITGDQPLWATAATLSYAGGDGVAAGGFDPILTLFDGFGNFLAEDDDSRGVFDPVTGLAFDALLSGALAPGDYILAVTQFDNFAIGPTLADGFFLEGAGDFTAAFGCLQESFCDDGGNDRTANFTVLVEVSPVPVPAALPLLLGGLATLGFAARRRRRLS